MYECNLKDKGPPSCPHVVSLVEKYPEHPSIDPLVLLVPMLASNPFGAYCPHAVGTNVDDVVVFTYWFGFKVQASSRK